MKQLTLLLILFSLFVIACESASNTEKESTQTEQGTEVTTGRSELAILMRNLYNYTNEYEEQVASGKPFPKEKFEKFKQIKTAIATEPKDIDERYLAMADGFLASLEVLTDAENVSMINYNNMIENCLSCHKIKCPGPMVIIRKLKLSQPKV